MMPSSIAIVLIVLAAVLLSTILFLFLRRRDILKRRREEIPSGRSTEPPLSYERLWHEVLTRYGGALLALLLACTWGEVVIILYCAQAKSLSAFLSMVGEGLLISGASFLVGGLAGFLFGIPRSLEQELQNPSGSAGKNEPEIEKSEKIKYRPNTNLEEISDWLTKILVGVGLTQIAAIREGLRRVGAAMGPVLGGSPGGEVFSLGILIYFPVCGFFIGFLWARLTLPRLYVEADVAAAERRGVQAGVQIGTQRFLDSVQKAGEVKHVGQRVVLWVDDRPENNVREKAFMEKLLGLSFVEASSTEQALKAIEKGEEYTLIISDMGRPGDPQAGYTLLESVKAIKPGIPVILYTGSVNPQVEQEARRRGALGITDNPQKLLDLVRSAL